MSLPEILAVAYLFVGFCLASMKEKTGTDGFDLIFGWLIMFLWPLYLLGKAVTK